MRTLQVFMHMPKTGGKTIESLLRKNYAPGSLMPIYRVGGQHLDDVFSAYSSRRKEKIELVYGHIPHVVDRYFDRQCSYFTMLRNPVKRFLSFYRYVKYDFKEHPLHHKLKAGETSIQRLARVGHPEANLMTKFLAGKDYREKASDDMLVVAMTNLEKMACVGIQEEFDRSCCLFAEVLGWSNKEYERQNVTTVTSSDNTELCEITDEVIERIADMQYLDLKLYRYATSLFQEQCAIRNL